MTMPSRIFCSGLMALSSTARESAKNGSPVASYMRNRACKVGRPAHGTGTIEPGTRRHGMSGSPSPSPTMPGRTSPSALMSVVPAQNPNPSSQVFSKLERRMRLPLRMPRMSGTSSSIVAVCGCLRRRRASSALSEPFFLFVIAGPLYSVLTCRQAGCGIPILISAAGNSFLA